MALIFLGKSTCALYGNLLLEGEAIKSLPPTAAHDHSLYEYFDRGFHAQCFDNWNKKGEVLSIVEEDKRTLVQSKEYLEWVAKHGKPTWLDE